MSCSSSTLICVSKHIRLAAGHDRPNETQWANRHLGVGKRVRELLTRSGYMPVIRERVRNGTNMFDYLQLSTSLPLCFSSTSSSAVMPFPMQNSRVNYSRGPTYDHVSLYLFPRLIINVSRKESRVEFRTKSFFLLPPLSACLLIDVPSQEQLTVWQADVRPKIMLQVTSGFLENSVWVFTLLFHVSLHYPVQITNRHAYHKSYRCQ